MPFTPFHMGPGILVKALMQGSFSLMVFGWAQIVMDIQPLFVLLTGEGHLHGFSHTYVGATLLTIFSALTGKYLSQFGLWLLKIRPSIDTSISWLVVFISAFIGCYSHVLIDSVMHSDVQPFYPFTLNNSFVGLVSVSTLHKICLYSGLVGAAIYYALLWRGNKTFATDENLNQRPTVRDERKNKTHALLKGIETGDPASVEVVHPDKYIQHNPQTLEGGEGLAELFLRLSKTNPRVNIVRLFSDGDFVFGHTEYDFSQSRVGFEVFRFEGEHTVEHWDNIQSRTGPNLSGRSMVDGSVELKDLEKTQENRALVKNFIDTVLINGQLEEIREFVAEQYTEHNPELSDGLKSLEQALLQREPNTAATINYQKTHRILAEGNFVLAVSEGNRKGVHTSFYDLFRIEGLKIVEHWDTIEKVPPSSEWKNDNGKF